MTHNKTVIRVSLKIAHLKRLLVILQGRPHGLNLKDQTALEAVRFPTDPRLSLRQRRVMFSDPYLDGDPLP